MAIDASQELFAWLRHARRATRKSMMAAWRRVAAAIWGIGRGASGARASDPIRTLMLELVTRRNDDGANSANSVRDPPLVLYVSSRAEHAL